MTTPTSSSPRMEDCVRPASIARGFCECSMMHSFTSAMAGKLFYRCCLSMVDSLDICETSVTIPLNPLESFTWTSISSEPDTADEQTTLLHLPPCVRGTSPRCPSRTF
jgi:hypothetical protein